jgi:predicted transcriptional regulator
MEAGQVHQSDTNQDNLPKGAISVRLTPAGLRRLERLTRIRDSNKTQVFADALIHMLASYERHEQIHAYVPSEQEERGNGE